MAWSLVSGQFKTGTGVTPSAALPNNPTKGNLVVVGYFGNAATTESVADANSNTYTNTTKSPYTSVEIPGRLGICWLVAPANASKTVTLTNNGSGTGDIFVAEFTCGSDLTGFNPFENDATVSRGTGSTSITTPSVTTVNNGDLIFNTIIVGGSLSSINSPWNAEPGIDSSTNGAAYLVQATAGLQATNDTSDGTSYDGIIAAFKLPVALVTAGGEQGGTIFVPGGRGRGPSRGLSATHAFPPPIVLGPPVGILPGRLFVPGFRQGPTRGLTPTRAFPIVTAGVIQSLFAGGRAISSGALGAGSFVAALSARGNANASGQDQPSGAVPIFARGNSSASGLNSPSGKVSLFARGLGETSGRIAAGTYKLALSVCGTAVSAGNFSLVGIVSLLARGSAVSNGRSVVINAIFLLARGLSVATGRIAAGVYSLALSVRGTSDSSGLSAATGKTPLLARGSVVSSGRLTQAQLLLQIFVLSMAAASGRVAAGTYKLVLQARGAGASSGRSALAGVVSLLAHAVSVSAGRAPLIFQSVALLARGTAAAAGRLAGGTYRLVMAARGAADASAQSGISGAVSLHAHATSVSSGHNTVINAIFLFARGTAAASARFAAGIYNLPIFARGIGAASGQFGPGNFTTKLFARGTASSSGQPRGVFTTALAAVSTAISSGRAGVTARVLLQACGTSLVSVGTTARTVLLSALGSALASGRAFLRFAEKFAPFGPPILVCDLDQTAETPPGPFTFGPPFPAPSLDIDLDQGPVPAEPAGHEFTEAPSLVINFEPEDQ